MNLINNIGVEMNKVLLNKLKELIKDAKKTTEIETELDKHIFETYGLKEEEIKIIENA